MADQYTGWILPLAFVIDLILGDPRPLPHPIRWMGQAIDCFEPLFRRLPLQLTLSGALFAIALIVAAWFMTWAAVWIAWTIHPAIGLACEIWLIYYCLSARSLERAAMAVHQSLKQRDLAAARSRLSMIVGRDTRHSDEPGVCRATVETVAENFVDGVVSPLLFAAIGGAPAAMAFKMASTLDSMVGYRNERYHQFGKVSARIDDVFNFIPARLSIPLIAVAARLLIGDGGRSWRVAALHGNRHLSPNSGYPEAAFAGALGLQLGGPNAYQGKIVEKPFIGFGKQPATPLHIKQACDLMLLSSAIGLLLATLIAWMV